MTELQQRRRATRAEFFTRAFVIVVVVWAVVVPALLLLLSVQAANRGRENRALLDQIHHQGIEQNQQSRLIAAQARTIRSCTTPGEPCFEAAQQDMANQTADINNVVILAAACAVGQTGPEPRVEAAIQRCVMNRMVRGVE